MKLCPRCGAKQLRRSRRAGWGERLFLSLVRVMPYRCLRCNWRFRTFSPAWTEQVPAPDPIVALPKSSKNQSAETPNTSGDFISFEKAQQMRIERLSAASAVAGVDGETEDEDVALLSDSDTELGANAAESAELARGNDRSASASSLPNPAEAQEEALQDSAPSIPDGLIEIEGIEGIDDLPIIELAAVSDPVLIVPEKQEAAEIPLQVTELGVELDPELEAGPVDQPHAPAQEQELKPSAESVTSDPIVDAAPSPTAPVASTATEYVEEIELDELIAEPQSVVLTPLADWLGSGDAPAERADASDAVAASPFDVPSANESSHQILEEAEPSEVGVAETTAAGAEAEAAETEISFEDEIVLRDELATATGTARADTGSELAEALQDLPVTEASNGIDERAESRLFETAEPILQPASGSEEETLLVCDRVEEPQVDDVTEKREEEEVILAAALPIDAADLDSIPACSVSVESVEEDISPLADPKISDVDLRFALDLDLEPISSREELATSKNSIPIESPNPGLQPERSATALEGLLSQMNMKSRGVPGTPPLPAVPADTAVVVEAAPLASSFSLKPKVFIPPAPKIFRPPLPSNASRDRSVPAGFDSDRSKLGNGGAHSLRSPKFPLTNNSSIFTNRPNSRS